MGSGFNSKEMNYEQQSRARAREANMKIVYDIWAAVLLAREKR